VKCKCLALPGLYRRLSFLCKVSILSIFLSPPYSVTRCIGIWNDILLCDRIYRLLHLSVVRSCLTLAPEGYLVSASAISRSTQAKDPVVHWTGNNRKDAPKTTIGFREEVACTSINEKFLWSWETVINLWRSYKRKIVNSLLVYRNDQGLLTSYLIFVKRPRQFVRQTIGSLVSEGVT
jgi:hypothetical protein